MRIQHNVTALNAYRNLRGNNLNLSKNLEKLSSGYRINRAGDDAAGLAISEKMRAQISGLDSAKKNAEDGISLVQTAEGALTEVHSMLNRMVTLATQSANGTYDNAVDRANLQKEVTSLKEEIDRISKSANFNGINLLDGSMSNEAKVRGDINVKNPSSVTVEDLKATAGKYTVTFKATAAGLLKQDGKLSVNINYKDENGAEKVKTINFKTDLAGKKLIDEDGNETTLAANTGAVDVAELGKAINGVITKDKELNKLFDIKENAGVFTFEAKTKGINGANIVSAGEYAYNADGALINGVAGTGNDTVQVKTDAVASDAGASYDLSKMKVWGHAVDAANNGELDDINKCIFEVNGEKFVFTNQHLTEKDWEAIHKAGVHHVSVNTEANADVVKGADVMEMAKKISEVTGLKAQNGKVDAGVFTADVAPAGTDDNISLKVGYSDKAVDKSLTLQIGDTAQDFNKMKVSIQSTDTKSLKIDKIDIGTQSGAADAIANIKNAINTVSSVRGDMGALQNRLEHTINNLGVMHENITDAESRIRDTDMAKEMMAYTKNNILVQSATAMLAQANQLPQSVLQLLQ